MSDPAAASTLIEGSARRLYKVHQGLKSAITDDRMPGELTSRVCQWTVPIAGCRGIAREFVVALAAKSNSA